MSGMQERQNVRLSPAQAEAILRRAAELHAVEPRGGGRSRGISPNALAEAADRAGIPKELVRRAMSERASGRYAEPRSLTHRLYGHSRVKIERQLDTPSWLARERVEQLLRSEQGLKLRRGTDHGSLWDPGDALGVLRRALDLPGERPLLKARCIELVVDERPGGCGIELTADMHEQRGEYLSLAGILAATFSIPAAIAGVYEPLYLLALPPAVAVPGLGFKLAYSSVREDAQSAMEALIEAAEQPVDAPARGRERHRGGTQERRQAPRFSSQRKASRRERDGQSRD
ncbi:hypothetical protein BH20ACT11_BH20ACT11_01880 [soil metagenome]